MTEITDHYENLLARHYTWMLGPDFDQIVTEQGRVLQELAGLKPTDGGTALDLGCGSGAQTLALSRLGYDNIIAVDTSPTLLAELASRIGELPAIQPRQADFTAGLDKLIGADGADAVVCMGDTITHLPDLDAVARLIHDACAALRPDGAFVLSYRELTELPDGVDRFIPVRADDETIMTCFLEADGDRVRVHDLIYTRGDDGWALHKSSYHKLRIARRWLIDQLAAAGFEVAEAGQLRGMSVIIGRR